MSDPRATTERLAAALRQAGAPPAMVARAEAGYYDDYRSTIAAPITALVADCRAAGLDAIADRAVAGEFDATDAEAQAWWDSPEGREARREFGGGR